MPGFTDKITSQIMNGVGAKLAQKKMSGNMKTEKGVELTPIGNGQALHPLAAHALLEAQKGAGFQFNIQESFRSEDEQRARLDKYFAAGMPGNSAPSRPGWSRHNQGLAIHLEPGQQDYEFIHQN